MDALGAAAALEAALVTGAPGITGPVLDGAGAEVTADVVPAGAPAVGVAGLGTGVAVPVVGGVFVVVTCLTMPAKWWCAAAWRGSKAEPRAREAMVTATRRAENMGSQRNVVVCEERAER